MLELDRLAQLIVAHVGRCRNGEADFFLFSKTMAEDWKKLPAHLQFPVEVLATQIRHRIPDDVGFTLIFDDEGTRLSLEYEDGNAGLSDGGDYYETRAELFGTLEETDWDEYRASSLRGMDVFDVMVERAADRPVRIPSSAEAAAKWSEPLNRALVELRAESPAPLYAVIYKPDRRPLEVRKWNDRMKLLGELTNDLTLRFDILAVLENGRELPFPEIEALKREVIERLGPISRAKAEGRFLVGSTEEGV